jgi:isopentenyl-diphosphate Delta-isomerase
VAAFPLSHELKCRAPCSLTGAPLLVDYILFVKAKVDLDVNPNEVQDTKYVTADDLKALFDDPTLKFTPWFKLICQSMLFEWWEHLESGLEKYTNEEQIRRML